MNSSETLLYYLFFDIGLGFVPLNKGYALDFRWAQGAYRAATKDLKVYNGLLEVVSENSLCRKTLPPQLRIFVGEVISNTFPVPKKQGPDLYRDQLRNMCISECMMLLCDELKFQVKSEAKEPVPVAWELVVEAFSSVDFNDDSVGKPTQSAVERVWRRKARDRAREDVKMLRWLENHGKANTWYNSLRYMHWANRFLN